MISLWVIGWPLVCAGAAWLLRGRTGWLRLLLLCGAAGHTAGAVALCATMKTPGGFGADWIAPDRLSIIFLMLTSLLFLAVSVHTMFWLPAEKNAQETRERPDGLLADHVFVSCLLAFLATMTLVMLARNFGLLWVAVEATTLVSAPLILFHRSARSLEAMWKYLLICSVGIGLALFGTMLLAVAGQGGHTGLGFSDVAAARGTLNPAWFKAAFIFILAGYGTKMGLAPFHTWLPDAHSEAPGAVSALLSGTLLNCSFLAILRFVDVMPEPLRPFGAHLLTALGLLSLAVAAFFIVRQSDFKRMLAYSSVEHMGLLALFCVYGGANGGLLGVLHLCGHSVIKMTLFLIAGNLLLACGTRQIPLLGGLAKRLPRNSWLWLAAILMICGLPPSPLFVTEFLLLFLLPPWLAATVLVLLFTVFAGMTLAALRMIMGADGSVVPEPEAARSSERLWVVPLILLCGAVAAGIVLLLALV
ncbi:MAG: proton-conducting transporter membrane subunit [Victivallaceae bacterium]|nr:proton-conducting transporter membrane subunit [Victivallaceae bacterium]